MEVITSDRILREIRMVLLKNVRICKKEGLVGITEEGVTVKLSAPNPEVVVMDSPDTISDIRFQEHIEELQSEWREDNEVYYQMGHPLKSLCGGDIPYNEYTKRG